MGFATKASSGLWALASWKFPERKHHHLLSHTYKLVLGSDFTRSKVGSNTYPVYSSYVLYLPPFLHNKF